MLYCVKSNGVWCASLELNGVEFAAMGKSAGEVINKVLADSKTAHIWSV